MANSEKLFTQQMREATKGIHDVSDKIVNAKLGVTMSDDNVWAEGLLVFYEVIKFLEEALERHQDSLIGELLIPGMARKAAFEADIAYYYGADWAKDYVIRPEVEKYLEHLREIEDDNPYLLMAYVYHLYMGIFSGGQILRKTRLISLASLTGQKISEDDVPGNSVTSYGDLSLSSLKKKLKAAINEAAKELDEETKEAILKEGVNVFKLNNKVVASISGVDTVLRRRLLKLVLGGAVALIAAYVGLYLLAPSLEGNLFSLERGPGLGNGEL